MARMKKDDLIEEARTLGIDVDEDEHYDTILEQVKDAREQAESEYPLVEGAEEDDDTQEFDAFVEEDPPPPPERPRRGWNRLGVYVGKGRPD